MKKDRILEDWRTSSTTTVFIDEVDKSEWSSCRGISSTNIPGKVCDRMIRDRVVAYTEDKLSDKRCFFLEGGGLAKSQRDLEEEIKELFITYTVGNKSRPKCYVEGVIAL